MDDTTSKARNRGQHASDARLFDPKWVPALRAAVADHSFLLGRGYGSNAALELVGNRYRLSKRQRLAILRMSASDEQVALRQSKALSEETLSGCPVLIDGFNLLILLENVLSGAFIFHARDDLYRDISSVHGSYKRVVKTEAAAILIGDALQALHSGPVTWILDRPVSNSGKLKTFLHEIAEKRAYDWSVDLEFNPDKVLAESPSVVITSDSWVLDLAARSYNLGKHIIDQMDGTLNVVSAD